LSFLALGVAEYRPGDIDCRIRRAQRDGSGPSLISERRAAERSLRASWGTSSWPAGELVSGRSARQLVVELGKTDVVAVAFRLQFGVGLFEESFRSVASLGR
jgi:hypothetical protein